MSRRSVACRWRVLFAFFSTVAAGCECTGPRAPEAPVLSGSTPSSPGRSTQLKLRGQAVDESTVRVFAATDCSGEPIATGTAEQLADQGIEVSAAPNTSSPFTAFADRLGITSLCSIPFVYVHDDVAPSPPVLRSGEKATDPAKPRILGNAESRATVLLYAKRSCEGQVVGSGETDSAGNFGFAIETPLSGVIDFSGRARDSAGNLSDCSAPLRFTVDIGVPGTPVLVATQPASPSRVSTAPVVTGTAAPATQVQVFVGAACDGQPASEVTSASTGAFSAKVTVPANTATAIYARAVSALGALSECSAPLPYVHDDAVPSAPQLTSSSPGSPSRVSRTPTLVGSAEPFSVVRVFANGGCSGTALATAQASGSGSFEAPVFVGANSVTRFTAQATDGAGNQSGCSPNVLVYVYDDVAPARPVASNTSPPSPSSSSRPSLLGSSEPGSRVAVFKAAGCAGAAVAEGGADSSGTFIIAVDVDLNVTTSLFVRATDAAGNVSACSNQGFAYRHDASIPPAPSFGASTPASPSRTSTTPTLSGTAVSGHQVRLYRTANCSGALAGSLTAGTDGLFTFQVTVPPNAATTFSAVGISPTGTSSACSLPFTYVHDTTAPPLPTLTALIPASPAGNPNPEVTGSAETGSTVRLYSDGCVTQVGSGTAAAGSYRVAAAVTRNAATTLRATATDAVGNSSACSSSTLVYVHDDLPPSAPALSGTAPASPSRNTSPSLLGTAEQGVSVHVFLDAACNGPSVAHGVVGSGGTFTLAFPAPADETTPVAARAFDAAGNGSVCVGGVTYTNDRTPPGEPTLASASPPSPSMSRTPSVSGTAEEGSTVRLFRGGACAVQVGTGVAGPGGAFSIEVEFPANTTSTLRATATDLADNASSCSASALTYVHDGAAPATPTLTGPASPSSSATIVLSGAAEASATIELFGAAGCAGQALQSMPAAPGSSYTFSAGVPTNQSSTFSVRATDAAGNVSACSSPFVYVHDGVAPAMPALTQTTPVSPSNDSTPQVTGTAEASSTVRVYGDAACATGALATGVAAGGTFTLTVTVPKNVTTSLFATATDGAGNVSECSRPGLPYTHDDVRPDAPNLAGTTPPSPSSNATPTVDGTAEPLARVEVFASLGCTGTAIGSGNANLQGAFAIPVTVEENTLTPLTVRATDAAGNVSTCSSSVLYVHDSNAPIAPTDSSSSPPSLSPLLSDVTVGSGSLCVRSGAGRVECWSARDDTPYGIDGLQGARAVAVSGRRACAIDEEGFLRCGAPGEPARQLTRSIASVLASNDELFCAVLAGEVSCWTAEDLAPVKVADLKTITAVGLGPTHGCAADRSGGLWCWSLSRPAGHEPKQIDRFEPTQHPSALAVGATHGCALLSSGRARCWALPGARSSISPDLGLLQRLTFSDDQLCGLRLDGQLVCQKRAALSAPAGLGALRAYDERAGRACGVKVDGRATCWQR